MDQLPLFGNQKRFRKFKEYHAANPMVFVLFRKFARIAKGSPRRGRKYFGARMICERIRWYTDVETVGEIYKISNNHIPYYSRLLMLKYPEFEGFFQTRDARFDATDEEIAMVPVVE